MLIDRKEVSKELARGGSRRWEGGGGIRMGEVRKEYI